MTENINSEALDKLFEIDGELYGAPSLVRMARIRASILHASSAWGSSDDGALIGALADEVERLRAVHSTVEAAQARINRTLQDHGRMLWRDDIQPHCPSFDLCSEYADNGLRCSPCAIKQSEAAGVEVLNFRKPYSPEEWRLNRRIAALEAELVAVRDALRSLIEQCWSCEKELTEEYYHTHYSGESEPLCKARAALGATE